MYYGNYYNNSFFHAKKRDLNGASISTEKGTDNKPNNTSSYNHDYYMRNKDKWGVKTQEYSDSDSDFDMSNWSEKNRIGDTNFFAFKNKSGDWVIGEEDMKWVLPKGVELTADIKEQLKNIGNKKFKSSDDFKKAVENTINGSGGGSKEFDIDAAALDVIRGKYKNGKDRRNALGDDYDIIQKRVNEIYAKEGLSKNNDKKQ